MLGIGVSVVGDELPQGIKVESLARALRQPGGGDHRRRQRRVRGDDDPVAGERLESGHRGGLEVSVLDHHPALLEDLHLGGAVERRAVDSRRRWTTEVGTRGRRVAEVAGLGRTREEMERGAGVERLADLGRARRARIEVDRGAGVLVGTDIAIAGGAAADDEGTQRQPGHGNEGRQWSHRDQCGGPKLAPDERVHSGAVSRSLLERKLSSATNRLRELREELAVADEQLAALMETADDARLRALVSETPLAGRDHQEAQRHADAMQRHRGELVRHIEELERSQDELLDRLVAQID